MVESQPTPRVEDDVGQDSEFSESLPEIMTNDLVPPVTDELIELVLQEERELAEEQEAAETMQCRAGPSGLNAKKRKVQFPDQDEFHTGAGPNTIIVGF